jgi:crotonobetainyl-CoA:carnitine CoA-transferase CaiB-like acyl-CoA transferase
MPRVPPEPQQRARPLARPLEGLRVLDLARVLAGPYVGRMLADLGADVVKVEPPDGDVTRKWGVVRHGLSGYFTQQNVGKRSVCVDLREEGGADLVRKLAAQADVVVENFRPGVLDQYGLGYEALRAVNPKLVMLSISGFGQHGPERDRAAYATVVHAETGLVHRQSTIDGKPPADPRMSIADTNAGLHGLVGLLAALLLRARTGEGQHVDIAMYDSMLATDDYVHVALDGQEETEGVITNDTWDVAGGPILLAGGLKWTWQRLSKVHGLQDGLPKDAAVMDKIRTRRAIVEKFFARYEDGESLRAMLREAGLAWGEVQRTAVAVHSPTVKARGSVAQVDDRAGGTRGVIQSPYRFSHADSGARAGAPYRGEHNRAALADWLGLSEAEVNALSEAGVLLSDLEPTAG